MSLATAAARLCSVVSRAAGDDPIGSAHRWDEAVAIELPVREWDGFRDLANGPPARRELFERLAERVRTVGRGYGLFLYAPQGEPTGRARVYRRPAGRCAAFERSDYSLGAGLSVESLIEAAILEPAKLRELEPHRLGPHCLGPHLPGPFEGPDLHACTHGSVDAACGKEGYPLHAWLRAQPGAHRAWRTAHFGGHRFAPTLVELPAGRYWGHLTPEAAGALLRRDGPLEPVARCYRGWAALDFFAQVAERACLIEQGWAWLDRPKAAMTLEIHGGDGAHPALSATPPDGALVRVEFDRDDKSTGAYLATVERAGAVRTPLATGAGLTTARQYRVTRLVPAPP